jgi:N-acetylglucosamine malate deacetylase 1
MIKDMIELPRSDYPPARPAGQHGQPLATPGTASKKPSAKAMRVLFLSPHTDDVELGAGGTLAKFKGQGHEIFWVVFSTAETSLPPGMPADALRDEFRNVVRFLGLGEDQYSVFSFNVRYLHQHRQEILEELVRIRKDIAPDLVIGPSVNDYHQDHQVVFHEMVRAFKNDASILSYELPWNHTDFRTQLFVKLDAGHLAEKMKLLENYRTQIELNRSYFTKEFVYGWAKMRGVQVKADYAEAFEVIRWIV